MSKSVLRIASRESALAMWQTEHVAALLRAAHPALTVEIKPMTTQGDQMLDQSLAAIGGKGLFLKELESAMLRGEADIAVHSMKDVPYQMPAAFNIGAVLARANPFDALVGADALEALPAGATVGTSSLRRRAQLLALRPDLNIKDLRGNVNTRLRKLDTGQYDAIVLAAAGLIRLQMKARIGTLLRPPSWLPAAAQGAIGIEYLAGDEEVRAMIEGLGDPLTTCRVGAERAVAAALGADCHMPLAAYAVIDEAAQRLHLSARVMTEDGQTIVAAEADGQVSEWAAIGATVAEKLSSLGAKDYLGRSD